MQKPYTLILACAFAAACTPDGASSDEDAGVRDGEVADAGQLDAAWDAAIADGGPFDGGLTEPMIDPLGPISTTPCDFTLNATVAGETYAIDCRMDLGDATVALADNVTLTFAGGEIVDGELVFAGGQIDGRFLNDTLTIEGEATLIDPIFAFYPSRWRTIVEGEVVDPVATQNRDAFEALLELTHRLAATRFAMSEFDAFFKTDGPLSEGTPGSLAISIPSDFHLAMSNSTHLRMQPHGHFRSALIGIVLVSDVTISGGHLHGERLEHDYESGYVDSDGATGPTHEWVNLVTIKSSQDLLVEGVTFSDATGDNLGISGIYFYFDPRHVRSSDIVIRGNRFLRARRTNLVVTNGERITFEGNLVEDGGIDLPGSPGTAPSANFNMEPHREREADGTLIEFERVNDVFFRDNTFRVNDPEVNDRAGALLLSHGNGPLVVENNRFENDSVSFTTTDGVEIANNVFENGSISAGDSGNFGRDDFVFGNSVHHNQVNAGEGRALHIAGNGVEAYENQLSGRAGLDLGPGGGEEDGLSNAEIWNNEITATHTGIRSINTMQNVVVRNNRFAMTDDATWTATLGNAWTGDEDSGFVFRDNTVVVAEGGISNAPQAALLYANTLTVRDNVMGQIQIATGGGSRMDIRGNTLDSRIGAHGVMFHGDTPETIIVDNTIHIYPSATPLNVECVFPRAGVTLSASVVTAPNTCIED